MSESRKVIRVIEDSVGVNALWTQSLDFKWAEVEFLLRQPILTEDDMLYTATAAEAGLVFTDEV